MVGMNLAARYKIWGDQGNLSLRIADPFKMQKYGFKTANGTVVQSTQLFINTRAVFLTVSRNFGKGLKLQTRPQDPDAPTGPPPT
jgi:hypothetical protein